VEALCTLLEHDLATKPHIANLQRDIAATSQGNSTIHRKLEKRDLYFESGALECRVSDADGKIRFLHASGESERSKLVPQFPKQIITWPLKLNMDAGFPNISLMASTNPSGEPFRA